MATGSSERVSRYDDPIPLVDRLAAASLSLIGAASACLGLLGVARPRVSTSAASASMISGRRPAALMRNAGFISWLLRARRGPGN